MFSATRCSAKPSRSSSSAYHSGRLHRPLALVAAHRGEERLLARDLLRDHVRRVRVVVRHLDRDLPARGDRAEQPGKQRLVPFEPLQRSVRKHEVELPLRRERRDVGAFEPQPVSGVFGAPPEHRLRAVEPERLRCFDFAVQRLRQLAGAAAEVHDAPARHRLAQAQQVVERLAPFVVEAFVLRGIPGARCHREAPSPRIGGN